MSRYMGLAVRVQQALTDLERVVYRAWPPIGKLAFQ